MTRLDRGAIAEVLKSGEQLLNAGRWAQAEAKFRDVLLVDSENADALYGLGIVSLNTGRAEQGIEFLRRSVAGATPNPDHLANLADALRLLNSFGEAVQCCQRALAIVPDHALALNNLGAILLDQKKHRQAVEPLKRAVKANPDLVAAQYNLGRALLDSVQAKEAIAPLQRVTHLASKFAAGHLKLAQALLRVEDIESARQSAEKAVALEPGNARGHFFLGHALAGLNLVDQAIVAFRRSVELDPGDALTWNNLAVALTQNLQIEQSLDCLEKSLRLYPYAADTRFHRALLLLAKGDYARGWEEYEWRWKAPGCVSPEPKFPQPLWDGREMPNSTLFIHCEQGFGDSIQFARYVPLAAARVGRVIFDSYPDLSPVFASVQGVRQLIPRGQIRSDFDVHCPLLSLPRALGTTRETIPSSIPYLKAPAESSRRWQDRLAGDRNLRVGLTWAAGTITPGGQRRSMPVSALDGLLDMPGATFYSIQKDPAPSDLGYLGNRVIDLSGDLRDFGETAAIMANLDLIITVDSAPAHLAGALGKPTWLLLARLLDWRWPLDQCETPWYPTMRLFWQGARGDWNGVITQVRQELANLVKNV